MRGGGDRGPDRSGGEESWGRSSRPMGTGRSGDARTGGYSSSRGGDEGRYNSVPEQRPEHMRLKLDPRSGDNSAPSAARSATSDAGQPPKSSDKWENLFKSGSGGSSAPPGGSQYMRPSERAALRAGGGGGGGRGYGDVNDAPRRPYSNDARTMDNDYDDPRFSGKFGRGPSMRDSDRNQDNLHEYEETNRNEVRQSQEPASVFRAPSDAELKKQAKAAERKEQERKQKEEKEAKELKLKQEKEAFEAIEKEAEKVAGDVLKCGKKSDDLAKHVKNLETQVTASALAKAILADLKDPADVNWCKLVEYGGALKSLLEDQPKFQCAFLYAIQSHCSKIKFPKIEVKGKMRYLIDVLIQLLFQYEIVDPTGVITWADDESDDVPGKTDALVQCTAFLTLLRDEDGGDDYEEEDDEVDAPREIVM